MPRSSLSKHSFLAGLLLAGMAAVSIHFSIERTRRLSVGLTRDTDGVNRRRDTLYQYGLPLRHSAAPIVLAGIVEDGAWITTEALNFLTTFNCIYQAPVHVLVKHNPESLLSLYDIAKPAGLDCADFRAEEQPVFVNEQPTRVDRLKHARDFQRQQVANMLHPNPLKDSAVVLVDLDLSELPLAKTVLEHSHSIINHDSPVDILCSAGVVQTFENDQEGYYDTFATVLLPDTFVYPLKGRLFNTTRPGEDASLVLGQNFSTIDLLQWFKNEGTTVPVKSCFGGLAIYRASKWLNDKCSYSMPINDEVRKYSNKRDNNPCEHVILHSCLRDEDPRTTIAVQTDMRTRWRKGSSRVHEAVAESYAINKVPSLLQRHQPSSSTSELDVSPRRHLRGERQKASRPVAILHVGPRKTGSTAIQTSIRKFAAEFEQDNFITIAEHVHFFSHCLASKHIEPSWGTACADRETTNDILANITRARLEGKNIIISSESLDRIEKVDPSKLQDLLEGFDIQIVVVYRRFFEWAISNFGQMYRHFEGDGWMDWKHLPPKNARNVAGYLTVDKIQDMYDHFYTPNVYQMYKDNGLDVEILNYHAEQDVVSEFFCMPRVNAPTACRAVRESTEDAPNTNRGVSISYDQIAVEAMELGWIDPAKVSRPQARAAVESFLTTEMGINESDLPHRCLDQASVDMLETYSTETEATLLPDFYKSESGSRALRNKFDGYRTTSFCTVDVPQLIQSTDVQVMFSMIEDFDYQ